VDDIKTTGCSIFHPQFCHIEVEGAGSHSPFAFLKRSKYMYILAFGQRDVMEQHYGIFSDLPGRGLAGISISRALLRIADFISGSSSNCGAEQNKAIS
jgi:hypothetical protein